MGLPPGAGPEGTAPAQAEDRGSTSRVRGARRECASAGRAFSADGLRASRLRGLRAVAPAPAPARYRPPLRASGVDAETQRRNAAEVGFPWAARGAGPRGGRTCQVRGLRLACAWPAPWGLRPTPRPPGSFPTSVLRAVLAECQLGAPPLPGPRPLRHALFSSHASRRGTPTSLRSTPPFPPPPPPAVSRRHPFLPAYSSIGGVYAPPPLSTPPTFHASPRWPPALHDPGPLIPQCAEPASLCRTGLPRPHPGLGPQGSLPARPPPGPAPVPAPASPSPAPSTRPCPALTHPGPRAVFSNENVTYAY